MLVPEARYMADLLLNLPVQVEYGLDANGESRIFKVSVVHGPGSLDFTSLLSEDDFLTCLSKLMIGMTNYEKRD